MLARYSPELIDLVLAVLVFWSRVLLVPRFRASSGSPRLGPQTSICFTANWTFVRICCSQLPYHPCKKGTHNTSFAARIHTEICVKMLVLKGFGEDLGREWGAPELQIQHPTHPIPLSLPSEGDKRRKIQCSESPIHWMALTSSLPWLSSLICCTGPKIDFPSHSKHPRVGGGLGGGGGNVRGPI